MFNSVAGSPIVILIIILIIIAYFVRSHYANKKCKYCNIGKMQEILKTSQGINSQSQSGLGRGSHSVHKVRMKVKYQCSNCGEFNESVENR